MKPSRRVLLVVALLAWASGPAVAMAVDRCSEFQVSDPVIGTGRGAVVTSAAGGGFLVVWHGVDAFDAPSVQARRFDANGDPMGAQVRLDTLDAPTFGVAAAGEPMGRFLVAWQGASDGDDVDAGSIQARLLGPNGIPLAAPFQVNVDTTGGQGSPAVSPDGAGGFVVGWASSESAETDVDGSSIHARRVDRDGAPVGDQFQVNVTTTGFQFRPDVVGEAGGGFVVSWGEGRYDEAYQYRSAVRFRRFAPDASSEGAEVLVGESTSNAPQYAGAGADGTGGFVVVWTGPTGLAAVRYDDAGDRVGVPIQVQTCPTCYERATDVAGNGAGGFMVVWEAMGNVGGVAGQGWDVHARLFDAAGEGAPEFKVNVETLDQQYARSVARDGDGFVVAWTRAGSSPGPIHARRLDARGCVSTTSTSTTTTTLPTSVLASGRLILREARGHRPAKAIFMSHGAGIDPGTDGLEVGGRLRIASLAGSFDLDVSLPGPGWSAGRRAVSYRGPEGRVRVKPGKQVTARIGLDTLTLGVSDPTPIVIVLEVGGRRLCTELSEATIRVRRGKLTARAVVAPTTCREPDRLAP